MWFGLFFSANPRIVFICHRDLWTISKAKSVTRNSASAVFGIISCVIPSVYEMFCEDYAEESDVFGINVLDKIKADYILLCEQYEKRSTENFELKN